MAYEALLIIIMILLVLQALAMIIFGIWFVSNRNTSQDYYKRLERKVLQKFKGISPQDQANIDQFSNILKAEVNSKIKQMAVNNEPLQLEGFPVLSANINQNPDLLASLLGGGGGLFNLLLPLVSGYGGEGNGVLGMINKQNATMMIGATIAGKALQSFMKSRSEKFNETEKKAPPPRTKSDHDFTNAKPSKVPTHLKGRY